MFHSWQRFDYDLPHASGDESGSSRLQSQAEPPKVADFTDRQLEAYLLPHPKNPSTSLQALYAAVRMQMVMDGCA
jgi:hypothetical protein